MASIAAKIGCTTETLRKLVRQAERDQRLRAGLTSDERERLNRRTTSTRPGKPIRGVCRRASGVTRSFDRRSCGFVRRTSTFTVRFCVLFLIVIQTSYLTPPIFYLRGISPAEITLSHMFNGVVPFILLQLVTPAIVAYFRPVVLWVPAKLLGF